MKVAVYARVSTSEQNTESQLLELREYCERRDWQVIREYVDSGISGAKEKRLELDKLLADAHRHLFDAVVVWRFDRFARSVSHLLRALENYWTWYTLSS
jgi:DNA invertase Pin-like site-specific DNA recombinase